MSHCSKNSSACCSTVPATEHFPTHCSVLDIRHFQFGGFSRNVFHSFMGQTPVKLSGCWDTGPALEKTVNKHLYALGPMEPGRGADGPGGRGRPHSQVIQRKSRRVSRKAKRLAGWQRGLTCFFQGSVHSVRARGKFLCPEHMLPTGCCAEGPEGREPYRLGNGG